MSQTPANSEAQNPATTASNAPYLWQTYRDDDLPIDVQGRLYVLCHVEGEGARRLNPGVTEADILPFLPQDGQDHNVRVDFREEGRRGSLAQIRLVLSAPLDEDAHPLRSSAPSTLVGQTPSAVEMLRIYTQGLDRAYGYAADAQRDSLMRAERAQANSATAQLKFADAALEAQHRAAKESEAARREILRQEAEAARDARERERAHAEKILGLQLKQAGASSPNQDLLATGLDLLKKAAPFAGMGFELLGGFEGLKEKATDAIKKVGGASENSPLNRFVDLLETGVAVVAEKYLGSGNDNDAALDDDGTVIDAETA